ncbi:hypothetical protein BP5796_09060 [Coleophoma crateriformis]|uniref:BRCT domain-containing protein n=1 Tax=Coleophoma crateriformis TaxID=565419 RepID=A0A3D8R2X8_9HELO|nr:hypothetical protein BP5796_09060 [Coleophoma crateriformis]
MVRARASRTGRSRSKQIFAGKRMAVAGDFSKLKWNYDQMINWIKGHGAEFAAKVDNNTTHLICTIEEFKLARKSPQVAAALKLGSRQCKIVVGDWLEDCLIGGKRARLLNEKPYTLDRVLLRIKNAKKEMILHKQKFDDGIRSCKQLVDNNLYQVYYDSTGFQYKVVLTRLSFDGRIDKNKLEKYTLYLYQSLANQPYLYMCGAMLSRPHRPNIYYREDCHPKYFHEAFADFKKFFERKTGVAWDDRLEGKKAGDDKFVWTPPPLGRPVGLLPEGYIRPRYREENRSATKSSAEENSDEGLIYDTESEVGGSDDEVVYMGASRLSCSHDRSFRSAASQTPSGISHAQSHSGR